MKWGRGLHASSQPITSTACLSLRAQVSRSTHTCSRTIKMDDSVKQQTFHAQGHSHLRNLPSN
eukprot:5631412-Amphidinium_carterae.3